MKNNTNMYYDEFMGFYWNGKHSSDYNCFIVNKGDLKFSNFPSFSNSFISPAFQNISYYTGTSVGQKTFSISLCINRLTLQEYNAFLKWLNYNEISTLAFDFDQYYVYNAKLSAMTESTKYVVGHTFSNNKKQNLYMCTLDVTFQCIGAPYAYSKYACMANNSFFNTGIASDFTKDSANYQLNTIEGYDIQDVTKNDLIYGKMSWIKEDDTNELVHIVQNNSTSEELADLNNKIFHYTVTITNPSSIKMPFNIYIYDVNYKVLIEEYNEENIIDTPLSIVLSDVLDSNHYIDLYYNSQSGAVISYEQMIENLISREKFICNAVSRKPNEFINPGESRTFTFTIQNRLNSQFNPEIEVTFNWYNYVV